MSQTAISIENLGKRYTLGTSGRSNERYTALRDVIAGAVAAPFRRFAARVRSSKAESWNGRAEEMRKSEVGNRVAKVEGVRTPQSEIEAPSPRSNSKTEISETAASEFWALRDVCFDIKQGEIVGIIGRNGAGKSTLLKILSRITDPTEGRIKIKGRIASLLEVGTGFHPELTGRENIYLNGAILGMSRAEIKARFNEIVAFAEVERFLDTAVKRYSSGMYVRLAFAVAAHLEPEILIVDEVLAVGDAEFQAKCLGKMHDVAQGQGRTVIFVSHQMNAIQSLCTRVALLSHGRLQTVGVPSHVISRYLKTSAGNIQWRNSGGKYDNPYFKPTQISLIDRQIQPLLREVQANEDIGVCIGGEVAVMDSALVVGFALYAAGGELLYWSLQTDTAREHWPTIHLGSNCLVCWIPQHLLNEGEYRLELIVSLHCRSWICEPGVDAPMVQFKVRGGLSDSPHWMEARPGLLAPILPFDRINL